MNKKQYAFVFDANLLPGLKRGDREAILKMGIEALNADKLCIYKTYINIKILKLSKVEGDHL